MSPPKRWTRSSTTIAVADGDAGRRVLGGDRLARSRRRAPRARAPACAARRGGTDDVAEHGAGLDRRELARVADEDQARVRAHRLDQPGHQRQRHHRGLVDDHDVVRQPVAAVVAEAAVAARAPAEQAVQRRGLELEQRAAGSRRSTSSRGRLGVHRLLRAARRPCRSARRGRRAAASAAAPARRAARRCGRPSSSCRCRGRRPRPRGGAAPPRRPPGAGARRPRRANSRSSPSAARLVDGVGRRVRAAPRRSAATWRSSRQ